MTTPSETAAQTAGPWMNATAAAEALGVSKQALYRRVKAGLIPVRRLGPGTLRFVPGEFDTAGSAEAAEVTERKARAKTDDLRAAILAMKF